MKNKTSIQISAAFLIIVFALNTLVGFACSVGINMGFNSSHHHHDEVEVPATPLYEDGKKHDHEKVIINHDHDKDHHHDELDKASKNNRGGCCNDKVIKLDQLDKSLAKTINYNHFVFFTTLVTVFHDTDLILNFKYTSKVKYFVRSHHPPIPDIRIAIQSFQI